MILERLSELRSISGERVGISAIANKKQSALSDIESGALSPNKELKHWTLLAHHYIELYKLYARNLSLIQSVGFGFLSKLLADYIPDLNYAKVGMMMNLHQDILSSCGLSSTSFNSLLRTLHSEPKVLGIKPSCCLMADSALIALVDGNPLEVIRDLGDLFQPISSFLIPTPGLVRVF